MPWKNILLKQLSRAFKHPKNTPQKNKKIRLLIVSTTGLGDTLWATPAIRAIKKSFPNSYLAVLTSPIGHQVLLSNPYIDEFFVIDKSPLFSCVKLFSKLKSRRLEIALIFHTSQRFILPFISVCGPQEIIGNQGMNKGLDDFLTSAIEKKPIHEIERRLEISEKLGISREGTYLDFFLTEEEKKFAIHFLKKKSFAVGIHPGSKDPFKRWRLNHFISLGKRLYKDYRAKIYVTGGKGEEILAKKVSDAIPKALSIAGKFNIRQLAALIEHFNLFLTNDTGPMHIAYAMKTATFSPFVPTHVSSCGPYQVKNASFIQKSPTCFPCLKKKCRDPFCLEQISNDMAWGKIKALLKPYDR